MIPGMSSRDMAKAMQRLGIQQVEIDAKEVVVKTTDKELIFKSPKVSKVNLMGQETYQIIGKPEERPLKTEPEISEEDIQTVMDQTGTNHDDALAAIKQNKGDLAAAILQLKK
ncbi:MAG: nascent polypeptide-associated complex protein [Candidatus Woesearchaeota archaeon]